MGVPARRSSLLCAWWLVDRALAAAATAAASCDSRIKEMLFGIAGCSDILYPSLRFFPRGLFSRAFNAFLRSVASEVLPVF